MKTLDFIHLDAGKTQRVVDSLQSLLADYQIFYANLRGFHWNIKGHGFFMLHSKFEELYDNVAEKVDEIAERILTLGGIPANKPSEYVKQARIKEIDNVSCGETAITNILETLGSLIAEERKLKELADDANDEGTVALASDYIREQEKLVWMLVAHLSK